MSTYSRINWQDSPSTATPVDAANLNIMDAGIDNLAKGLMTLTAGQQETGFTGNQAYTLSTNQLGWAENFRKDMTNVPSSITLTTTDSHNLTGSVTIQHLSVHGFWAYFQVTNSDQSWWNGTYVTVGNCLLRVDASARTFDHHCDTCRRVALDVPFAALQIVAGWRPRRRGLAALTHAVRRALRLEEPDAPLPWIPGVSAITYTCAHCGTMEAFNTALTGADERDETLMTNPHSSYRVTYGEQARRVRMLLRALGKPLIEDTGESEDARRGAVSEVAA